jgi:energy-coupling factor transporter ATP-binding protein EcfA2
MFITARRLLRVIFFGCMYLSVSAAPVITENEIKELQLEDLFKRLNHTQTGFGAIRLKQQLINPTADVAVIQRRQQSVRCLLENDQAHKQLVKILVKMEKKLTSLYAYWDQHDDLNKSAEQFYFAFDQFNNKYLLEGSMAYELGRKVVNFACALGLHGLWYECTTWLIGGKEELDIVGGIQNGFTQIYKRNNPFTSRISENYAGDRKQYCTIMNAGTLGDMVKAVSHGYTMNVVWPIFGERKYEYVQHPLVGNKALGLAFALGITAWYDWHFYTSVKDGYTSVRTLQATAQKLHKRMSDVAVLFKYIEQLHALVDTHNLFVGTNEYAIFERFFEHKKISRSMHELLVLLRDPVFNHKKTVLYPRGKMLRAHKILKDIYTELKPLLEALGDIDATSSVALVYKKHAGTAHQCSFVEFVSAERPYIQMSDVWVPLIDASKVVSNSITIGGEHDAQKILITGPNGSGKSTLLKALGQAVVCAQSWGIVPARHVRMTAVQCVGTCLAPQEDIQKELSSFMAQDMGMMRIQKMLDASAANYKVLALIDEPWRGTMEAASANYIYDFGLHIASLHECLVCIATHVQKPIELAQVTGGAFVNMQVLVNYDAQSQQFERIFKIAHGPALWWFHDELKRSCFIKWLKKSYGITSENQQKI